MRYDDYLMSWEANQARNRMSLSQNHKRKHKSDSKKNSFFEDPNHATPSELAKLGMIGPGVKLSPDSTKFVGAMVDPENPAYMGAGVPDAGQGPSMKKRSFIRTKMTVGTEGTGFAMASPIASLLNNVSSLLTSTSAYASDGKFPETSGSVGVLGYAAAKSALLNNTSTDFGRVVGSVLKISPVGKVLDLSGLIVTVCTPSGKDLMTLGESDLMTTYFRQSRVHEQPRESHEKFAALWTPSLPNKPIVHSGAGASDTTLANASQCLVQLNDISSVASYNIGIIVTGAPPGFEYFVEFYTHYEIFPSDDSASSSVVRQAATPSYTDSVAMDLVDSSSNSTLNAAQTNDEGKPTSDSVSEWVGSAAKNITYFADKAQQAGKILGANLPAQMSKVQPALDASTDLSSLGGFLPTTQSVPALMDSGPAIEDVTATLGDAFVSDAVPIIEEIGEAALMLI